MPTRRPALPANIAFVMDESAWVAMGEIRGFYGLKGWLKIFSFTEPRHQILTFPNWYLRYPLGCQRKRLLAGKQHGKGVVAHLAGYENREQAAELLGKQIVVRRAELPELPQGEFYWADLVGLSVHTTQGQALGAVARIMATGANDVLVVEGERERLIPYLLGQTVANIDLNANRMVVNWDPEF